MIQSVSEICTSTDAHLKRLHLKKIFEKSSFEKRRKKINQLEKKRLAKKGLTKNSFEKPNSDGVKGSTNHLHTSRQEPHPHHNNFPRTQRYLWISGAPEQETCTRKTLTQRDKPPEALDQSTAPKKNYPVKKG